jgi:hypothetical protein
MRAIDLTGQQFGKLTAIKRNGTNKQGKALWLFRCECGNQKTVPAEKVKRPKDPIRSCGCIRANENKGFMAMANQVFFDYNDGDLTLQQFYEMSQLDCYYCGAKPANQRNRYGKSFIYNGLDRLNNSLPHNLNNCVPCCWKCNQMKKATNVEEFIQHITTIYHRVNGMRSGLISTISPSKRSTE